jgi:hypothetical protein
VRRSLSIGAASGPSSTLDCAIAPSQLPKRLRSFALLVLLLWPGFKSRPTQIIACWAANKAIETSVLSLSPLCAPELVKPAEILLRHFRSFHANLVESSKNCLSFALMRPL